MFTKLSSLITRKSCVLKALPVAAVAATALALTAPAKADGFRIGFGFNFAPPVYYAPAYCPPAPVYVPPPVYAPACPPVYSQPVYVAPYRPWGYWHRREEWREHHFYGDRDGWHRGWDRR